MEPLEPPIPDERPLTAEELRLARWMLENGEAGAWDYLPQLRRVRVVSRCGCGCATIDLQVEGYPRVRGILRVLGEFSFSDGADENAVFIYESGGGLGGIEVYGLTGDTPTVLPTPEMLRPMTRSDADSR